MSKRKKEISRELNDQLRSVSFTPSVEVPNTPDIPSMPGSLNTPDIPDIPDIPTLHTDELAATSQEELPANRANPFYLNRRVVTLEYLDKFEQATKASAQYDTIKDFSHLISNLSIILLVASIVVYLIFYFINPHTITLVSLVILFLQAFTLLGLTLYTMTKASTAKQIRDILVSDFSTCSQAIGNPKAEAYIPLDTPNIPT